MSGFEWQYETEARELRVELVAANERADQAEAERDRLARWATSEIYAADVYAGELTAELTAARAVIAELVAIAAEFNPDALTPGQGHNTPGVMVRGLGIQRDHNREVKDHLAIVARNLTTERDQLRAVIAHMGDGWQEYRSRHRRGPWGGAFTIDRDFVPVDTYEYETRTMHRSEWVPWVPPTVNPDDEPAPDLIAADDHVGHEREWDGSTWQYNCLDCSSEDETVRWFQWEFPAKPGPDLVAELPPWVPVPAPVPATPEDEQ